MSVFMVYTIALSSKTLKMFLLVLRFWKAAAVGRYENLIQSVLSLWGFLWHLFFIMCSVLTQGQWHPEHFTYSFCVGLL